VRALSRTLTVAAGTAAMVIGIVAVAWAEPPAALPGGSTAADATWQPAFDYDGDGCYPTPAIGPDGTLNPGLKPSGALNGECHDPSDLDNTNSYSRSKCNHGWCAYLYDLYFEKDQAIGGWDPFGHRHDLEHVVVWVNGDAAKYVSVSRHGDYDTHPASDAGWEGTHAKVVYHKDGATTHCFRLAAKTEQPENDKGTWQHPTLVGWDFYPPGIRDKLTSADFGEADLGIKDSAFANNLTEAMPAGIPFDPNA
jgi:necrosis inducing protein (NPP1)